MSPGQQLYAAVKFDVQRWVRPSLKSLLSRPLSDIPLCDIALLGEKLMHELLHWSHLIRRPRQQFLAKNFDYDPGEDCTTEVDCAGRWSLMWTEFKDQLMADSGPYYNVNLRYIHNHLGFRNPTVYDGGVCQSCWDACAAPILRRKELLAEEDYIQLAVDAIYDELGPFEGDNDRFELESEGEDIEMEN